MKLIKFLGGLLFAIGISIMIITPFGLDNDLLTFTQYFEISAAGFLAMFIGGVACKICDAKEGEDE